MTLSQIAGLVVANRSAKLIRPKKMQAGDALEYDAKEYEGNKRGWTLLDATTANAITLVYNKLNDTNRAKFDKLSATKAINICWQFVK